MLNMESLYCRIHGRVQLVMFRDFATRKARGLGLVGYVRNLEDGSVEAYAQGEHAALERWLRKLQKGSLLSHVEYVDAQWNVQVPADMQGEGFDSFEIVF